MDAWLLVWPGSATALVAIVLALLTTRFVVPSLPEPPPDPEDLFEKPAYASLVRPGVVVPAMMMGGLAGLVSPLSGASTPAFVAFAGVGAALVSVDLATTYLPSRLQHLCSALVVAVGAAGLATLSPERWRVIAFGALFGAVAAFALFWLIWRLSNSFGYGDVRLATLTGAVSGSCGVEVWWQALVLGTLLGALSGLAVALWRRRRPHPLGSAFPYGPALWAGPFLALLWA